MSVGHPTMVQEDILFVADSGTVYFQHPADLRQRKSKRTPSTPPRQHKSSFSLMSESKPKENEG